MTVSRLIMTREVQPHGLSIGSRAARLTEKVHTQQREVAEWQTNA